MANNDLSQQNGGYKDANDKELAHNQYDKEDDEVETTPENENSLSMDDGTTKNSQKDKPYHHNGKGGKDDDSKENDANQPQPQQKSPQKEVDKIIAKLRSLKRSVNRGCISFVIYNMYNDIILKIKYIIIMHDHI